MTQLYVSVVTGTAATLMAITLLSLRLNIDGHRPVLALVRRWVATGARTSGLVLVLISAIAVYSFARIPMAELSELADTISASTPIAESTANDVDENSDQAALDALRAFTKKIDPNAHSAAPMSTASNAASLPDVNTMIAMLVARLEKEPGDVKGWKMLGWSYLNTEQAADAEKAYETARKIDPNDVEAQKGLEAAKAAQTASETPLSNPGNMAAEENTDAQRDDMIRGMVDRLAKRLEASPNDEDGWVRLMQSRMTLGDKTAAKAALAKALEAFAGDPAAKERVNSAARELHVGAD
ncbi:hypothetical protein DLM45_13565 [Hyphomicrobium methylovorum]|uniref:tetratricopeptide repeat protein n=1 Tax=Hyphomicrobium methylovorum TaxID=84 RepID=UPI0015E67F46|nr:tetratricopeptide repeat protein [Hyphomicrobium methylovorum]MBA2127243.1 hypothetical protein [Hyphomicrobium methylovorum]